MESKRTKATKLTSKVKQIVYERDNYCCILCGSNRGIPEAHYISRAKGGLGIPENVVTLCRKCHDTLDNGINVDKQVKEDMHNKIKNYLQNYYIGWDESKLIYRKY